jgi:hypothetical protein
MKYSEFDLTDLGYVDGEGAPLASIAGRDNAVEPFRHRGYVGYPDGRIAAYDRADKRACLAVFAAGAEPPAGGTEIAAADVPALLIASYGWPAGTTLGQDGLPAAPAR